MTKRLRIALAVPAVLAATVSVPVSTQRHDDILLEQTSIKADDGIVTEGMLYSIPSRRPKTVVVTMHPNDDRQRHYMLRPAAERGFAGYGMKSRWAGEHGIHEELLLDIAAAVRYLKKERGFERVVFTGQSGGGSLFAFYQSQAETAPPNRLKETPAGDPPDLNKYEMIPADGIVILNANEGEGLHLTHHLDPSIIDENDPLSVDPALDMYNPANGFKLPPESSRYSAEFTKKFRAAQWARAERLTERARSYVRERNLYRSLMKQPAFETLPLEQRLDIERRAEHLPMMVMYRTEADLDYTDQITRPTDRAVRLESVPSSRRVQSGAGGADAHDPSGCLPQHDVGTGVARPPAREHRQGDRADAGAGGDGRPRHLRLGAAEDVRIRRREGQEHRENRRGRSRMDPVGPESRRRKAARADAGRALYLGGQTVPTRCDQLG